MEFKLKELFLEQAKLDKDIQKLHNVTYEGTREKRYLAFLVELGELANATRCFKFWSLKPAESNERILDEFADGLHFILSIGVDLGYEFDVLKCNKSTKNPTKGLLKVYDDFNEFYVERCFENYIKAFTSFLTLVSILGFNEEQLIDAYYKKLKVNYERQEQQY
jgi:dimeric dUTPase (all-alpha-NTP-PPase superfamily)